MPILVFQWLFLSRDAHLEIDTWHDSLKLTITAAPEKGNKMHLLMQHRVATSVVSGYRPCFTGFMINTFAINH